MRRAKIKLKTIRKNMWPEYPFPVVKKEQFLIYNYSSPIHRYDVDVQTDFFTVAEAALKGAIKSGKTHEDLLGILTPIAIGCPKLENPENFYNKVISESYLSIQIEKDSRKMFDNYLKKLKKEGPKNGIKIYDAPLSTLEQIKSFIEKYHINGVPPKGEGVQMGEYAVAKSHGELDIIATDYLIDCVAVVLVAQNSKNADEKIVILGHVNATTCVKDAIKEFMREIPKGYTINASLFGSPKNDNPYMNAEVIYELTGSKRISSLSVNVDGPTAVAVHINSGTVLTAYDESKSASNSYEINTIPGKLSKKDVLPVIVNFEDRISYEDDLVGRIFMTMRFLHKNMHPLTTNMNCTVHYDKNKLELKNPIFQKLSELTKDDGIFSVKEQAELATIIAKELNAVGVTYKKEHNVIVINANKGLCIYTSSTAELKL